jgi:hypothetical protein
MFYKFENHSTVGNSLVQYSTVEHNNTVQYGTGQSLIQGTVHYSTVEFNSEGYVKVPYSTVQYSTVEMNLLEYSRVQ